jgi:hypothetical protein
MEDKQMVERAELLNCKETANVKGETEAGQTWGKWIGVTLGFGVPTAVITALPREIVQEPLLTGMLYDHTKEVSKFRPRNILAVAATTIVAGAAGRAIAGDRAEKGALKIEADCVDKLLAQSAAQQLEKK